MVCNHEKREHVNYCGDCGADLTLREDEIKARDKFFEIYRELLKEKNPDVKFDRGMFDTFIRTNGATMSLQIMRMLAKDGKIEIQESRDDSLLKLERKKLERLAEPQLPEKIIRFPDVYKRICPVFCMLSRPPVHVLRSMEREGMIEIVRKHGIRLKSGR